MPKYENFSKEELLRLIEKQEQELKQKKYGLVWDAEREPEQVVLYCENNLPVLKRVKGKEIRTDLKQEDNILIEGDNYHALTVLNYTHKEKIDVIYIDPPYNTKKEGFTYNDRRIDENNGFRHSCWLSFMEKRLNLAKELMSDGSLIFISIGVDEFAQLKMLLDKIFGENNFVSNIIVKSNPRGKQQMIIPECHEYLLVYSNNINKVNVSNLKLSDSKINEYNKVNSNGKKYREIGLRKRGAASKRIDVPNLYYPIYVDPKTEKVSLVKDEKYYKKALPVLSTEEDGRWRWGKDKFSENKKRLYGRLVNGNRWDVFEMDYLEKEEKQKRIKPFSIWDEKDVNYEKAKAELKQVFNGESKFDYPKTVYLIKKIVEFSSKSNSLILDFFAGSGTTGQAVLDLNKEDGGNRKFILCTNNENSICTDVCYPRVEKVIKGYKKNGNSEKVKGLGGNMQYFKTAMVKKTRNKKQARFDLTQKCSEMLCVKENIFNQEAKGEDYKIYSSNKKDKYLCVYFNYIENSFKEFLDKLRKIKKQKIVYMFSLDNKVDKKLYAGIKKLEIKPIPQKILDVYDRLVKMNIPMRTDVMMHELSRAKDTIFMKKEKDEGARKLRIVLEKAIQKIAQTNSIKIFKENGKEEKIARLNDLLKKEKIISKVEWEENKTHLTIGNQAAHGEYDEYNLKQIENFFRHTSALINKHNI